MNFLTQLGVLAIILIILVILIKSNQTLEEIYMEGEQDAKTIEIPSFRMPKIRFSERKNEKKSRITPKFSTDELDEEAEKTEVKTPVGRSLATVPRETASGWYVETLDEMGRSYGRRNVSSFPFTIGRSSGNDYVLDDLSVSSYHASLEKQDGVVELVDQGSLNKIFVGGREVTETPIVDRMEVCLGNTRIRFGKEGSKSEHTVPYKKNSLMEEWY